MFAIVAFAVFSLVPAAFADSISVNVGNSTYDIEYTASDLEINSLTADTDFISLIFQVEVLGNQGQLELNLSLIHI